MCSGSGAWSYKTVWLHIDPDLIIYVRVEPMCMPPDGVELTIIALQQVETCRFSFDSWKEVWPWIRRNGEFPNYVPSSAPEFLRYFFVLVLVLVN